MTNLFASTIMVNISTFTSFAHRKLIFILRLFYYYPLTTMTQWGRWQHLITSILHLTMKKEIEIIKSNFLLTDNNEKCCIRFQPFVHNLRVVVAYILLPPSVMNVSTSINYGISFYWSNDKILDNDALPQ